MPKNYLLKPEVHKSVYEFLLKLNSPFRIWPGFGVHSPHSFTNDGPNQNRNSSPAVMSLVDLK